VAVARDRGLFKGRDDGLFHPADPVTYAEVITALLRLVGRGPEAAIDWPWGAVATAAQLGMIPPDMGLAGRVQEPASRGNVFRLTAIAAGRIPMANSPETVLQSAQDRTPPTLDLTAFPAVTGDHALTVNGKAFDAVTVMVGDRVVDVQHDGSFSARLSLVSGDNPITVLALDGAGNRAEGVAHVKWVPMARLEINPTVIETSAGQPFTPVVSRYDATGKATPAANVSWSYDTSALSRDPATGAFKAVRPGEYVLRATVEGVETTARVVVSDDPAQVAILPSQSAVVAGGAPVPVTIKVLDKAGRQVTAGSYAVQLSTIPAQAVTFDSPTVTTKRGEAIVYIAPGTAVGGIGLQALISNGRQQVQSGLVPLSVEQRRFAGVQLTTVPPNVVPTAGQSVQVVATAVDQNGMPMAVRDDVTVHLSSSNPNILQFTRTTAVIRAGTSASDATDQNGLGITGGSSGMATIYGQAAGVDVTLGTLNSVLSGPVTQLDAQVIRGAATADGLSAALVAVTRRDAAGKVAAGDRSPVVLMSQTTGASISPYQDAGGVTLFAIRSNSPGRISLTAGVPGRSDLNAAPVTVAMMQGGGAVRPVLKTTVATATAGTSIAAYVALDGGGSKGVVANPGPPLTFTLQATGGTLATTTATIPTGATRSKDVIVNVPADAKGVTLSGSMVGGAALGQASVSVRPPATPPAEVVPTGDNLVAIPSVNGRSPYAGEEVRFLVRTRSGATLQPDTYTFGYKLLLNGQPLTDFPEGLTIRSGSQVLLPDDLLRTTNGEAELWVQYTGVGTIGLQPVAAATPWGYDKWGVFGWGTPTDGYKSISGTATFTAGALDHMQVTVSPNLGDPNQAVIKAARGRFATIRIAPVDSYGNPAGNSCVATLTRISGRPDGALALRSAVGDLAEQTLAIGASGYADFNVYATTDALATSVWSPLLVCGSTPLTTAQDITVSATVHTAPTPTIEFAGGNGSVSGSLRAGDDSLKLRIAPLAGAPETAELLVYDGTTMIGRYGPVQGASGSSAARTVTIPKSDFSGPGRYIPLTVRIHSGSDVSEPSATLSVYWSTLP
jgi:hypothetical protein